MLFCFPCQEVLITQGGVCQSKLIHMWSLCFSDITCTSSMALQHNYVVIAYFKLAYSQQQLLYCTAQ